MFHKYKSLLSTLFFLLIGVICIYFVIKNQEVFNLINHIKKVHFFWYLPVLISTIFCHYFRTKRWQLLLDVYPKKVPVLDIYNALMSAYVVNFITGKLGELYRCGVLYKKNDIPFSFTVTTVIIERTIDVMTLIFLFLSSMIFYKNEVFSFISTYIEPILFKLSRYNSFFIIVSIILILLFSIGIYFRRTILAYLKSKMLHFYEGLIRISQFNQKPKFFMYTILIWLMYLLMTYFWFFAFNDSHLTIGTALLVIVIGGIGRSLPIPGHGLGAYHICAGFALSICMVNSSECLSIPLVIHAGQTLFYVIFGSISMLLIGVSNWKLKNE